MTDLELLEEIQKPNKEMDDLKKLMDLIDSFNSCVTQGHVWGQTWTSSNAETTPPENCPVLCMKCGTPRGD